MTIRLTDLRKAAMHEYPELREEPEPEPPLSWWQFHCWWATVTLVLAAVLAFDLTLVILFRITGAG